jgi:hypothetical protein
MYLALIRYINALHYLLSDERRIRKMKKRWIIITVFLMFALANTVSAYAPINFSYNGDLVLKYLGKGGAVYDDQFGIDQPLPYTTLGHTNGMNPATPGTKYENLGKCLIDNKKVEVVLFIKTPPNGGSQTYYSNAQGPDGKDHANVTKQADGSFYVGFEDWTDSNFKDVQLTISCIPKEQLPIPTPEFPLLALQAAFIVGMLGAVLFIRRTTD